MNPYVGTISGMKIASGRATWDTDANKKGFWNFLDVDAFTWYLNPGQIKQMKVSEEDVLDCVEQAEKELGSPDEHRPKLGLFPNSGYTMIGKHYVSRSNPHIVCIFTPTSISFPSHNPIAHDMPPINAYFEWYYSDIPLEIEKPKDLVDFLVKHDTATGSRATNVSQSPTVSAKVPSYNEASERSEGLMGLQEREQFLNDVWNYHKNTLPGFKARLESEILEVWERVNRVHRTLTVYEG